MKIYSPSTKGFYDSVVNGGYPEDGILITDDHYHNLLEDQAMGLEIFVNEEGHVTTRGVEIPREKREFFIQRKVSNHILHFCNMNGFESTLDAVSYSEDKGRSRRKTIAKSIRAWRSDCLDVLETILQLEELPHIDDVVPMLPILEVSEDA